MIAGAPYILVIDLGESGLTDVLLRVKKPSSLAFEELTLEEGDFQEAEGGFYNLKIKKEDTLELGTYIFKVEGYELDVYTQRECLPQPLSSAPAPGVCVVTGNVRNISGVSRAYGNTIVSAQPLKLPANVSGSLILGKKVNTYADHDGFFSLPLIVGMTVLIEMPDAGVRFQTIIPDVDTVRIEDLIP